MADLRVSHYSSQTISPTNKQQIKRITYLSIIPVLVLFMLVALFGMMGALPTFAQGTGPFFVTPGGSGSDCSIAVPCLLETAVSQADSGAEIRVAKGTYTATDSVSPVLALSKSLILIGGYDASWGEPNLTLNETILDGEGTHRVISITAGISPAISNFFIKNGKVTGARGAGIFIASGNGQPVIANNVIENNIASLSGGGIYDGAGSIIEYNEIFNNQGTGEGGGGIVVENDVAGITSTIRFNKIFSNTAGSTGGGILLRSDKSQASHVLLIANEIYNNKAQYGGGVGAFQNNTEMTLFSNMIVTNTATGVTGINGSAGGGLYTNGNATLWNNTFAENTAAIKGGGIALGSSATAEISNNIIAFNTSATNDGIDAGTPGNVTGTNNNIHDDATNVTLDNTVTTDPGFVNRAGLNFHIQGTSLAIIDGGSSAPSWVNVDIDEQERPNPDTNIQDMGADEYYADFAKFELTPPSTINYVERGNIETFTHYLNNTGTVSDTYTFECSSDINFTVTYCASPIQILAGGSPVQITTSVEINPNLTPNYEGKTLITATSTVSNVLSETALVRSIVAPHPDVSFTPNYSRTELPGDIITLTHVITNDGDAFDTFIVTILDDPNGWAELIPTEPLTVEINAGAAKSVRVQIQVPEFAPAGLENIIQIQAASQFSPTVSATVVNTITAKPTVGTRFVSKGGSDTDNNCTQPGDPCATIGQAVGQAASGDEIRIGPGTYKERNIALNDVFYISGGWKNFSAAGQGEEPDPSLTIIDAAVQNPLIKEPVFIINPSRPEISVLTMENGRGGNGGAVYVASSAEPKFNNVVFRGNQAQTRGGAVFVSNNSTVSIEKGVFITNTASDSGGAIYLNGGNLFLRQSSFLTNTTNSSNGGAFAMSGGLFTGQNNLFHNNEASSGDGGAVSLNGGTAIFNFNTWVANDASSEGGGIYNNGATLTVTNSIFSENSDGAGRAIFVNSGKTGLDYLDMWQNGSNVVTGTHSFTADPLFMDALFRLDLGSPAIDTASGVNAPSVDFEDDARPSDEGYDIGYDERAGCRTKRGDIKYGSIQAAVDADSDDNLILVSGICRGVHTIEYDSQTISQTVHLTKSVIIQGGWNGDFSKQYEEVSQVDPEGRGRAFFISDGVSVTIEAISVTNGSAAGLGGGPLDEDAGGGFYNVDGQVTLRGVNVLTSTADLGAGFYNDAGNPLLTWFYIEKDPNNEGEESYILTEMAQGTAVSGGGIYNNTGELNVDGAWLHHNQATDGGGLFNLAGPITVANTIIDSNTAVNGGGLYNEAPTANYLHMTVYSNTATANGGGFYNAAGDPVLYSTIFESNRATAGSAIYDADNTNTDFANYNYYYDNQGNTVVGTVTGTNSIVSALPPGLTDPLMGDFHLLEEAPAAEQADPVSPIVRDFEDDPRPSNQSFDIGADEIVGCLVQINDTVYGSLQAAINDAEPGAVIKVSGNCSGVHEFSSGLNNACGDDMLTAVNITKTLTLLGGWDEAFVNQDGVSELDARNLGRVMYIGSGVSTTIESFAMLNGIAANGAGICIDENAQPTLRENRVYSNTASANGGGIYSVNSHTNLEHGNFIYNNEATTAGGGLFLTGNSAITATVQNNFVYSNTADIGAGIYSASGDHVYWLNTIYGNSATNNGGGFVILAGSPEIRGNIIMANQAVNNGGAVYSTTTGSPIINYNDNYQNMPDDFLLQTGDISVDPGFANIISGVFTITIDSPVVDIDIPDLPVIEDYEEDIRISHQGYDLGADEVGGCFAKISDQDTIYGSVQKAVDEASAGDTVLVNGICQNVNNQGATYQTLFIDKDLTIDGSLNFIDDTSTVTPTLQANGKGRVVYIDSGAAVTLTNILLRDGDAAEAGDVTDVGGGVYNAGTLIILDAWIQQNSAEMGAGLYNAGILTIDESYVLTNTATQNGGGIYNDNDTYTTTIQNSTIRANQAGGNAHGGGIYQAAGDLTVDKNRINANIAGSNGAGLYLNSGSASVDVRNNFIYNNNANTGGGLYNANTDANIWHNTFYKNTAQSSDGGGIANAGGKPSIHSNIIDRNTGSGFYASGGTISANFNNVVGHLDNYVPGTLAGADDISAQPDYVAPSDGDFHLNQGSAGEDVGDPALTFADDIDGDLRPTNGGPDIGADEINSCLVRVGKDNNAIFGVLQDAIDYAYAEGETSIEIARGECRGVKYNATSDTWQVGYITSTLNFVGSLRRKDFSEPNDYYSAEVRRLTTMINADDEGHVIYIAENASPTFAQIAFVDGNATRGGGNNGGAIYKAGAGEVHFSLNYFCGSTAVNGGGIYIEPAASLDITGISIGTCSVKQITEDEDGNIIEDKTVSIPFTGNEATNNGGGFYIDGYMSMRNAGLYGNLAGSNGGGGYIASTASLLENPELINATFYLNVATNGTGGALHNEASGVKIYHNTIRDNFAVGNGGGVYNNGNALELNSSIVYANTSISGTGGGIYDAATNAILKYNNFHINSPDQHPGSTNNPSIDGDPGLRGIRTLSVHSINIDKADPDLLLLPKPIDYDYFLDYRPDGDKNLDYLSPHGEHSDVGADEYFKDFGCAIESSETKRTATPGTPLTYTLLITNTGNIYYRDTDYPAYDSHGFTDTLTVTIDSETHPGWSVLEGGAAQSVLLGWDDPYYGEATTRVLTVTVPEGTPAGTTVATTILCQSQSLSANSGASGSVIIETDVGEAGGVRVDPLDPNGYDDSAIPGEVRVYTYTVTNLQNRVAEYRLTALSGLRHANAVLLDPVTFLPVTGITVTLQPNGAEAGGYTTTAYMQVTILDTAIAGDYANPGLNATDNSNGKYDSYSNRTLILGAPATRYVAGDSGANSTNCADPLQPCATIQYAVDQAFDEDGNIDDIKVAAFTYTDYTMRTVITDTVEQVLFINKSVSISGGYTTTELVPFTTQEPITNAVKLDGLNLRRVIYVTDGVTPTLSSLFIENGKAVSFNNITGTFGSGIYNAGADLTIYGTWIQTNIGQYGAGIYHEDGLLTMYSNILAGNSNSSSFGQGGGLYMAAGTGVLENNTFADNKVNQIGSRPIPSAISAAPTGFGGGIFLDEPANATVTNNIFSENSAVSGTAVYISSTATLNNSYNLYAPVDIGNSSTIANGGYGVGHILTDTAGFVSLDDYHIAVDSAAKDTGTNTVSISETVDIDLEDRIMGVQIDIGADERTQRPGFVFEPTVLSATIDTGDVYTYYHWITNTGDFVDSYNLEMFNQVIPAGDTSWDYHLDPISTGNVEPLAGLQVTLVVTGGLPGYVDVTTITATSGSLLSASVEDTTTISQTAGVDIEQSDAQIGLPGLLVTYTHTLTNTGNGIDQFELTATAVPTDWIVTLIPTQTAFLSPTESIPVTVTVLVPADAISDTQHVVTVTAVATDPYYMDFLTDTTTVGLLSSLILEPDNTRPVPDGTSTVYTHTLTSNSNIVDSITLTATGSLPGWDVAIDPEAVTMNPLESRIISVTVTVPPDTGGLTHLTHVTATSTLPGLVATATNTTKVPVKTGLLFTPNLTETVYAGEMAYYTHTLTNLGNLTDTFNIISNSVEGWIYDVTGGLLEVGPGASVQVTAVISVPLGTPAGIDDILEITAISQAVVTTTATVTDTTRVIQFVALTFTPDHDETADAGTTKVYTHTLTNDGDGSDTFDLTYSGVPAWTVTLEPSDAITLGVGETAVVTANLTIPSAAFGLVNTTSITATSQYSPSISATVINTTTVLGDPVDLGVLLEPDRFTVGNLGETITYYHTITNTGDATEDFGLSVASSVWTTTVEPAQIELAAGASAPVTVTVMIPPAALAGEEDMAVITAVSQSDPSVSSSVTDTTRVVQTHGLVFFPDNAQTTDPSTTVFYTHTLQNTGNAEDTFAITPNSAHGWTVAADSPVTVALGESTTVHITLTVPAGTGGQVDVMQVTASSIISPAFTAMVTNTTTVNEGVQPAVGVDIEPDYMDYAVGGDVLTYVHVVTNTGESAGTFSVNAVSSQRWTPDFSPASLTLGVGETGTVIVTVTVPTGVNPGTLDETTVTVTSQSDATVTDSAVDTTIIPGVFLPIIMKPATVVTPTPTPPPGPTVTPSPTATPGCTGNTGIDLIVERILVDSGTPAAGIPAVVHVTIKNRGTVDVAPSNNFYVDFYVDRTPVRYLVGEIEWGVQGEWMQAGQSYTFTSNYTFSGGAHQLWAQVDTDNTVNECPFENNNVLGPLPITVSGTSNVTGQDGQNQQSAPNDGPRHTPTPNSSVGLADINVQPVVTERPLSTPTPTLTATPPPP